MAAAFGEFRLKLDEKGRIILPAKTRPQLADGTYLTRGQDRCLFLFSDAQFEAYRRHMADNAPTGIPPMAFDRIFYSSVVAADLDKQGRLTVPAPLRQYAGLERDLVIVALERRMELWDAAAWDSYYDRYVLSYSTLNEGVR
ncbi:MAG: division/cell wall cluster transcriptional repressor MraZ [Bifidobacteriaceae bacterium]|jgi:MraZ protein|nr:division/cell wall cluster transcriptional repressor MraZ [Bifidobacteriaceae bacterium]